MVPLSFETMLVALSVALGAIAAALLVTSWRLRREAARLERDVLEVAAARDRAQALLQITEAVNSSLALEEIVTIALARCVQLLHARGGAFYVAARPDARADAKVAAGGEPASADLVREASVGLAGGAGGATRSIDREPLRSALAAARPVARPLRNAPALADGTHATHAVVMPVQRSGKLLGAMELYLPNEPDIAPELAEMLHVIAAQTAGAIVHAHVYREQEESSLTDELTGLPNRRYLGRRFLQERQRARRMHRPLGVLMLDLDHFKRVNDTHGHVVGDRVLSQLADILRATAREADICARYGGEEFAVIVVDTTLDGAMRVGGRIRAAVEVAEFASGLRLTVSIGVACTHNADRFADLFELADAALYEAKAAGRNQVRVSRELEELERAAPVG